MPTKDTPGNSAAGYDRLIDTRTKQPDIYALCRGPASMTWAYNG